MKAIQYNKVRNELHYKKAWYINEGISWHKHAWDYDSLLNDSKKWNQAMLKNYRSTIFRCFLGSKWGTLSPELGLNDELALNSELNSCCLNIFEILICPYLIHFLEIFL